MPRLRLSPERLHEIREQFLAQDGGATVVMDAMAVRELLDEVANLRSDIDRACLRLVELAGVPGVGGRAECGEW